MNFDPEKILQSLRDTPLFVLAAVAAAAWVVLAVPSVMGVDPSSVGEAWRVYAYWAAVAFSALSVARMLNVTGAAALRAWADAKAGQRLSFNAAPSLASVNNSKQHDGTYTTQIVIDIDVVNHSGDVVTFAGATLVRPRVPPHRLLHVSASVLTQASGRNQQPNAMLPHSTARVRLHALMRGMYALPGSSARFVVHDTYGRHHRFPRAQLQGIPGEPLSSLWARLRLAVRNALGAS